MTTDSPLGDLLIALNPGTLERALQRGDWDQLRFADGSSVDFDLIDRIRDASAEEVHVAIARVEHLAAMLLVLYKERLA